MFVVRTAARGTPDPRPRATQTAMVSLRPGRDHPIFSASQGSPRHGPDGDRRHIHLRTTPINEAPSFRRLRAPAAPFVIRAMPVGGSDLGHRRGAADPVGAPLMPVLPAQEGGR